jgi:hypothetical protein
VVGARVHLTQGRASADPARQRARRRQGRRRALLDRLESSGCVLRQPDPVDRRVKRVFVTKQARGFLEKLRKEADKFNAQLAQGIDRKALESTSEALLAMKRNLLAMSDGSIASGNSEEEDAGKKAKPRKSKKAA